MDIPLVRPGTVRLLTESCTAGCSGNVQIVYPTFSEKRGHPTMEECSTILKLHPIPEKGLVHGRLVAQITVALCLAIMKKDQRTLDPDLCRVCGLLHDIAKGHPSHEKEGGRWLRVLGFARAADIVAAHKDMALKPGDFITEKERVHLADNLGAWEGLTVDQVKARFPGAYEQRGQDLEFFRPEGGESFGDLAARSYPALLALAQKYHGPLLVVAHAGVNRVLLSHLQHKPLQHVFTIPQDYCGVNILRRTSGKVRIETINLRKPVSLDPKGYLHIGGSCFYRCDQNG